jgi:hypothetical protein
MNAITELKLFFEYDLEGIEDSLRTKRPELKDHEIWEISAALRSALSSDGPYFDGHGNGALLSRANGHEPCACVPLIVAIAKEHPTHKREFTLSGAIEALLKVYTQCYGMTSIGVLVTDVWRPGNLKNREYDLRMSLQIGIKTVPLLVTGRAIQAVKFPWE